MTESQLKLLQEYKKIGFKGRQLEKLKIAIEEEFLNNIKYNETQKKELKLLLEYNRNAEQEITEEQLRFIANPDLEDYEMHLIRLCYERNIQQNEIEELLNKNFGEYQIYEMINGLENGLTIEEVIFYANPELDDLQMKEIRLLLEFNATLEHKYSLKDFNFITPKFGEYQMEQIRLGLENGLPLDEVRTYAKPEYDSQKMYEKRCALEKINKEIKKYNLLEDYRNLGFNVEQLKEIEMAIDDNLTVDEINIFANLNYNENQMRVIREGIMLKLDVSTYTNPDFSEQQMTQILLGLKAGIDVSTYAKLEMNATEMSYVREALESGILSEKALLYAKKRYNYEISLERSMDNITLTDTRLQKYADMGMEEWQLDAIKQGLDEGRDVSIYAKTIYNASQMYAILDALRANLTNAQIETIANPDNTWLEMDLITTCYIKNVPQNEVDEFLKYSNSNAYDINSCPSCMSSIPFIITNCLKENFTIEQTKLLISQDYDSEQREELKKGFKSNLSSEQMNYLSNPDLDFVEMRLVRLCYEKNASQGEIEELLNTEFDWYQLEEINKGLENGLTLDEVKIYANPEFDNNQMKQIRLGLEHKLTLDEIKTYANSDIFYMEMRDKREKLEKEHEQNEIFEEIINPISEQPNQLETNNNLVSLDEDIAANKNETKTGPTKGDGPDGPTTDDR